MDTRDAILDRLALWAQGKPQPPVVVDLNPTNRCNLKCLSCWQRAHSDLVTGELSKERYMEIVEEGRRLGVLEWMITGGGEPLARRDVTEPLMLLVKRLGMRGVITTNGTLFRKDFIRSLVESGWDRIVLSVDGADARTQDLLRGKAGTFAKVEKSVEEFSRRKKRYGRNAPTFAFNSVLSSENLASLSEIVELAGRWGVDYVHFEPITIHSEEGKHLALSESDLEVLPGHARDTASTARRLGVGTNAAMLENLEFIERSNRMVDILAKETRGRRSHFEDVTCFEPFYHMVMKPDGAVGPCCLYYGSDSLSIADHSLSELWFGSYFGRFRDDMIAKRFAQYCSICNTGQVLANRELRRGVVEKKRSGGDLAHRPRTPHAAFHMPHAAATPVPPTRRRRGATQRAAVGGLQGGRGR